VLIETLYVVFVKKPEAGEPEGGRVTGSSPIYSKPLRSGNKMS
jgi:hypothetical protein